MDAHVSYRAFPFGQEKVLRRQTQSFAPCKAHTDSPARSRPVARTPFAGWAGFPRKLTVIAHLFPKPLGSGAEQEAEVLSIFGGVGELGAKLKKGVSSSANLARFFVSQPSEKLPFLRNVSHESTPRCLHAAFRESVKQTGIGVTRKSCSELDVNCKLSARAQSIELLQPSRLEDLRAGCAYHVSPATGNGTAFLQHTFVFPFQPQCMEVDATSV